MEENKKKYSFDAIDLIIFLWKRRMPILILSMLAAVISIIVSYSIDEKYKSEVVVFPTAAGSVSHDLLSVNVEYKKIMRLGEDEEVEQLLQVLKSNEIRSRIIKKYDLMNHYEIDTTQKYKKTALDKEFDENIAFLPTKFMSVRIKVLDKNPQIAADIANDIANLIDTVMNNMRKERALEALNLVKLEYNALRNDILKQQDSLSVIRSKGVIDYESQAQVLSKSYAEAVMSGKTNVAKKIQQKLDTLAKYGGAYVSIRDYLEVQQEYLSNLKSKYAEAVVDATQNLPNKYVVNKAYAAEKKSYPIRWLIVVLSTLSTFLFSIFMLILVDNIGKRIKQIRENK